MSSSITWQRDDGWVGSEIEDSFVMVNIDSGKYVALNSSASTVWNALSEPRSEDELAAALMARFTVDAATCRASLAGLLGQMQSLNMAAPV